MGLELLPMSVACFLSVLCSFLKHFSWPTMCQALGCASGMPRRE